MTEPTKDLSPTARPTPPRPRCLLLQVAFSEWLINNIRPDGTMDVEDREALLTMREEVCHLSECMGVPGEGLKLLMDDIETSVVGRLAEAQEFFVYSHELQDSPFSWQYDHGGGVLPFEAWHPPAKAWCQIVRPGPHKGDPVYLLVSGGQARLFQGGLVRKVGEL